MAQVYSGLSDLKAHVNEQWLLGPAGHDPSSLMWQRFTEEILVET